MKAEPGIAELLLITAAIVALSYLLAILTEKKNKR
jgi:hypothetical protein